ncbi:hypothetical protein CONPUDRAFT_90770 [Coniophora puteana RWD-64-598 SS2]|uniref:Cation/H+ exchanger transmembrane domain-containing protein n=1 Tax=Coniophora puteana (strain RWD-64-598) TaxID=741705 RepID=A0A5M3MN98_CONPW|nr:uncharacterized protein CONPUDRAFT_90770 [Coniophora puteana RWD-64-598 SS2]EIW80642.1 hypothetical protein CONPUDRAFT_90770 [Coniophora puteana RWD-64-598 SS2]
MASFSGRTVHAFSAISKRAQAPAQGGLLTGVDPASFSATDTLKLWIIQLGVILMMAQVLSFGLKRIGQPKVIAEILGGILLGPTAFGRIPGFTSHIFPSQSIPYLTLVADIGLCLFLFIIGLEINGTILKRNGPKSAVISLSGMVLPFGLGAALSVPLYKRFIDPDVAFTHYMLFTGVAYSITAFPVLCRILTELQLLDTQIGVIVLSAAQADDVVGWVLLALSVALVNAGSGITALYILLTCLAFILFLLLVVRRVMHYLARVTGSIDNGPTMVFMTATMLVLFGSAFFTDIIGVNAIFGAFLAGLIVPRDGGLAIALTEKLEDMVTIVFIPLYFTISGLNTNLGLLNTGTIWGFTIAIITLSFTGKFCGCTMGSRLLGFSWRESSTIGALMSCKGLVELIVLNTGLSAGILTQQVFSMFVLEALVLTFMTTPLASWLYPEMIKGGARRRTSANKKRVGGSDEADSLEWNDAKDGSGLIAGEGAAGADGIVWRRRLTVVLDKFEHVPALMSLTQLIALNNNSSSHSSNNTAQAPASAGKRKQRAVSVDALRLIELTDRTSAVMRTAHFAVDVLARSDPLLAVFRTFGALHGMAVSAALSIVPYDDLARRVADHAQEGGAQLVVLPWLPPSSAPDRADGDGVTTAAAFSPFEALFGVQDGASPNSASANSTHSQFVRSVFAEARTDVALAVGSGIDASAADTCTTMGVCDGAHVFVPFFGGPDDRLALEFVVQLCANERVRATVVRVSKGLAQGGDLKKPEGVLVGDEKADEALDSVPGLTYMVNFPPDTIYANATTHTRLQNSTADDLAWARVAGPGTEEDDATTAPRTTASPALRAALSRITFDELSSPVPLHAALTRLAQLKESLAASASGDGTGLSTRLLVLCGRSRRLAVENHDAELKQLVEEQHGAGAGIGAGEVALVRKTIGDVGAAVLVGAPGAGAGMVVVQAGDA